MDRSAFTRLTPYPFLDPANGGYASVAAYIAAIFVLLLAVSAVVAWLGNAREQGPAVSRSA